jgi:hypothetical protein
MAEARGQFGSPHEGESPPFKAVIRGQVNTQLTEKTTCLL